MYTFCTSYCTCTVSTIRANRHFLRSICIVDLGPSATIVLFQFSAFQQTQLVLIQLSSKVDQVEAVRREFSDVRTLALEDGAGVPRLKEFGLSTITITITIKKVMATLCHCLLNDPLQLTGCVAFPAGCARFSAYHGVIIDVEFELAVSLRSGHGAVRGRHRDQPRSAIDTSLRCGCAGGYCT